jgi:hypothetical protein
MENDSAHSNNNATIINMDDVIGRYNENSHWLNGNISQYIEDEDAILLEWFSEREADLIDYDDNFFIRGIRRDYRSRIKIDFGGLGFRRGSLFMESIFVDYPLPPKNHLSNWYVGFTVAGNGTPAFIFPVNNENSQELAGKILLGALL